MDCPFCHEPVLPAERPPTCPGCGASYHPECWECTGACGACGAVTDDDDDDEAEDARPEQDASPVARPLPGFGSYDVILGGGFGGGSVTNATDPAAGMVVEEELGEVLLELEGRKHSPALLVLFVALGPLALFAPCVLFAFGARIARALPFARPISFLNAGVLILGVVVVLALGWAVGTLYETARVTITERGVVSRRATRADFVPWSQVAGYRVERGHVLLLCADEGQLGIPTADEERRREVLRLLDAREVKRFG